MKEQLVPAWLLEQGTPIGKGDHPLRELIADIIDGLEDERTRFVLNMWAYEGLTFAAIAEELGLAGRQGGQYAVRAALKVLKEKLIEQGVNFE